jgi:hypothetical protein
MEVNGQVSAANMIEAGWAGCGSDLLTYLLTPWCRILFEKLSLSLSKNILLSLWNPKVHHRIQKSPPLDPILSQLNPLRPIHHDLPKM